MVNVIWKVPSIDFYSIWIFQMLFFYSYLNQQDDKLCDDVSQHDLGGGHSGHPASIQKSFLPLNDEWEGSLKKHL